MNLRKNITGPTVLLEQEKARIDPMAYDLKVWDGPPFSSHLSEKKLFLVTNGCTPEETMQNVARIASPGMTETKKTIVEIQAEKMVR